MNMQHDFTDKTYTSRTSLKSIFL